MDNQQPTFAYCTSTVALPLERRTSGTNSHANSTMDSPNEASIPHLPLFNTQPVIAFPAEAVRLEAASVTRSLLYPEPSPTTNHFIGLPTDDQITLNRLNGSMESDSLGTSITPLQPSLSGPALSSPFSSFSSFSETLSTPYAFVYSQPFFDPTTNSDSSSYTTSSQSPSCTYVFAPNSSVLPPSFILIEQTPSPVLNSQIVPLSDIAKGQVESSPFEPTHHNSATVSILSEQPISQDVLQQSHILSSPFHHVSSSVPPLISPYTQHFPHPPTSPSLSAPPFISDNTSSIETHSHLSDPSSQDTNHIPKSPIAFDQTDRPSSIFDLSNSPKSFIIDESTDLLKNSAHDVVKKHSQVHFNLY